MVQNTLLFVEDDPRANHRPAEAIRIAAGLVPWEKVRPSIYLHGPAVLALSEETDDLVDEEHFRRHLPLLIERGVKIYVQKGQPMLNRLGKASIRYVELDSKELASLAAASDLVFRF